MAFHEPLYGPGAHYFYTPTAGGEVDRSRPTQVGRALERLGVEHIAAYSPQARGRSERVFHTLQDRLVKELALKEIDTVEAANLFLCDVYIPEYNARFAVAAAQEGTAFVAIPGVDLAEILCVQEERQSATIIACRSTAQAANTGKPAARPFRQTRVKVRQYPDGTHAISTGRDALDATIKRAFSMKKEKPLESARRPACGNVDKASALTTVPQETKTEEADF